MKEDAPRRAVQTVTLRLGDCVLVLSEYEDDSLRWIVCDPPYG
jgi:predicted methyltransferase